MIAFTEAGVVAVVVATIAAGGSIVAARYAHRAVKQGSTTNGHDFGELIEQIADRTARVEVWLVEHLRDHTRSDR